MITGSFVLCAALATTGCSAAGSAVGRVLSPKPPQQSVTVVNNVEPAPAPAMVVVERDRRRGRSLMEKVGILTTSTVVGAGVGALLGDAIDADAGAAALLGAGVGAAAGYVIVKE